MSEDRKILIVGYNHIIKDLLDNYDSYTDGEKSAVKKALSELYNLNRSLNIYDNKPRIWEDEAKEAYNKFFGF